MIRQTVCLLGCLLLTAALASCSTAATVQPSATPVPVVTVLPVATSTPGATSTPACLAAEGTTTQVHFHSALMGETFTATVYLPPCYDTSLGGGYPVLYLLHG